MLKIYFVLGLLMSYFYYWHNEYCTPYVYSFFCICEYVIVLSNMVFHATAYYDFSFINVVIPARSSTSYMPLHTSSWRELKKPNDYYWTPMIMNPIQTWLCCSNQWAKTNCFQFQVWRSMWPWFQCSLTNIFIS